MSLPNDTEYTSNIDPEDSTFRAIAERIIDNVWDDPELTAYRSSDEEHESDIEIIDPDLVNPDCFDWEAHYARIRKFLVQSIRAYSRGLNGNYEKDGQANTQSPEHSTNDEFAFILKKYTRLIEKMRKTKAVHTELKIRELRKQRALKKKKDFLAMMEEKKNSDERRQELEMEADQVIKFWLLSIDPEKSEMAYRAAEKIAAQHIEVMEKFMERRFKIFDTKDYGEVSVASTSSDIRNLPQMEKAMKLKLSKKANSGCRVYLMVKLLRKWFKNRMVPLKRLKEKDKICRRCKENEALWRSYRRDHGFTEELGVEDGRRFISMLLHNGGFRVLKDYLKILLSKPELAKDKPLEDSNLDNFMANFSNEEDEDNTNGNSGIPCITCNKTCIQKYPDSLYCKY